MIWLYFLISHIKGTETKRKFIKITRMTMSSTGPHDWIQNLEYFLPYNSFRSIHWKPVICRLLFWALQVTKRTRVFSLKEFEVWDSPRDTVRGAMMKMCTQNHGIPEIRMPYCGVRDHFKGGSINRIWTDVLKVHQEDKMGKAKGRAHKNV